MRVDACGAGVGQDAVLVVDDVADSGKTLKMVMDLIDEHGLTLDGSAAVRVEARSAVIYKKPVSIIEPTTCGRTPTSGSTSPGRRCPSSSRDFLTGELRTAGARLPRARPGLVDH